MYFFLSVTLKVWQQPTTTQWAPNPNLEAMLKDMNIEQNIDDVREEDKIIQENSEPVNNCTNPKQTVVSLIVQELQKELERPIAEVNIIIDNFFLK